MNTSQLRAATDKSVDEKVKITRGQLFEQLTRLYLRLNGFFTSGFIPHSEENGCVITEVDFLAVRFRHHSENERIEPDDPFLSLSTQYLEFAICEVKSRGQQLHFNDRLYNSEKAVASVLHWAGIFPSETVPRLTEQVRNLLTPSANPSPIIPCLEVGPQVRIRALLFSPERMNAPRPNQPWFVCGETMLGHIGRCLCPSLPRESCATNYGPTQWADLAYLVAYFKNHAPDQQISLKGLLAHFHLQ